MYPVSNWRKFDELYESQTSGKGIVSNFEIVFRWGSAPDAAPTLESSKHGAKNSFRVAHGERRIRD